MSALGTVTASLFPPVERTESGIEILSAKGTDKLEIVSRLNVSAVNDATLDGLRIMVDELCSEYASASPVDPILEGRQWLRRITELREQRLGFRQRRDALELAGWLGSSCGCLEYDLGDRRAAEAARQAALSLGQEVDSPGIIGWAFEMRAWFALASGTIAVSLPLPRLAGRRLGRMVSPFSSLRRRQRLGLEWANMTRC